MAVVLEDIRMAEAMCKEQTAVMKLEERTLDDLGL